MKLSGALTLCLLLIGAGCESQSETALDVNSTPDVRERMPGFAVRDITGPWKGRNHCCQYGFRPMIIIFARELDGNVQDLVKSIDVQVGEYQNKLAAYVAVDTEDKEAFEPRLKALASAAGISHTPLTIIQDAAPP